MYIDCGLTDDLVVTAAAAPEGMELLPTLPALLPNHRGFRLPLSVGRLRAVGSLPHSSSQGAQAGPAWSNFNVRWGDRTKDGETRN